MPLVLWFYGLCVLSIPMPDRSSIYHLVPVSELQTGLTEAIYTPQRFAIDGFVHCADTPATTIAVANDYFAALTEPLSVLEVNPGLLSVPLKFEAPAPLPGGRAHLDMTSLFPHVYGPIDVKAIVAAGLMLQIDGQYVWPTAFHPLTTFLEQQRQE